jgi:alkylated DNA repair dioxygenase AlkB
VVPYQGTLAGDGEPRVDEHVPTRRIELGDGAWIDVARGWLLGADTLLEALVHTVEWRCGRRLMFDRMLDDPRLSRWFPRGVPRPHPALDALTVSLEARLGVPLPTLGCNYYRDGNDSVAWHADRELRELSDTRVAILTLGACRPFLIRPTGGGRSIDLAPGSGDLLVMGGSCQQHFQHSVPKRRACGPRVSCSWRWSATMPTSDRHRAHRKR